ncbi:MAG: flagellar FliJ family protein [Maricaulaceae bacterium]|jgi:flagellar export protein FliJ
MRSYQSLIRLARFKVEELQKQMAMLDIARGDLERKIDQLSASVPEEQVAANASKDGFVAYGSYAQAVITRKQNLRVSIEEVEGQASALREELEGAFAELKKFELLEERRAEAQAKSKAKREQDAVEDAAQARRAAG